MPAKRAKPAPLLARAAPRESGLLRFYPYQEESIVQAYGISIDEWARQTGKTFTNSSQCLLTCIRTVHAHVVTMSASLRQGSLVIRKDAEVWRTVHTLMRQRFGQDSTRPERERIRLTSPADNDKGQLLDVDAIADMLETGRLEAKIWHSNSSHSLHQIFAANPETARGATCDFVFWDEGFLTPEFLECLRALRRMIARRPTARFKIASTPPISSSHESWQMLYHEDLFPTNPRGNWRKSAAGEGEQAIPILRVSGYDAEAAGIVEYDELTRQPITIADARAKSNDKEGFDREALLKYGQSGTVAIQYSSLKHAQAKGLTAGGLALDLGSLSDLNNLTSEQALREALRKLVPIYWTGGLIPAKDAAFGWDVSSSDKSGSSNPNSFTCTQERGIHRHTALVVRWLCLWPRVNDALIAMLLADAKAAGARLKGFGIDGSNDMLNARRVAAACSPLLPCSIFQSGAKHPTAGVNWKEHLGGQYTAAFTDNLYSLPPAPEGRSSDWLLQDHSLVIKVGSSYVNTLSRGNHGDTFDSGKLAEEILSAGIERWTPEGADAGEVATHRPRTPDESEAGFTITDHEPGEGAFAN